MIAEISYLGAIRKAVVDLQKLFLSTSLKSSLSALLLTQLIEVSSVSTAS